MGLSESTMSDCINGVLGSFDCTCKSKCMESCKCMICYYHCRTSGSDIISESEDENDEFTPSVSETPFIK